MTERETRETQIAIFRLLIIGRPGCRLEAGELICKLDPQARRDLRAACQNLDVLIENVWLEELREKRIERGQPQSNRKGN